MSGYDGREFLARVQVYWADPARRTSPTGCWVCDHLDRFSRGWGDRPSMVRDERERCELVSGGIVDAHHLLGRRVLKRECRQGVLLPPAPEMARWDGSVPPAEVPLDPPRRRSLDDLLMDPRNGIVVRRFHHDQLEGGGLAIPVALLPADAREFAEELGLLWVFENNEARRVGAGREW